MKWTYAVVAVVCLLRMLFLEWNPLSNFGFNCFKDFAHLLVAWCASGYKYTGRKYYANSTIILIVVEVMCFAISRLK